MIDKAWERVQKAKREQAKTQEIDISELRELIMKCQPKHLPADFQIEEETK